ncbi:MAG: FdtA/QdtA family cupin domain-containing protein [Ferruginibacter sp.]|nr:FdtA/QdtA family cupin domain-containing protein [Cytophagales bacterium]
MKQPHLLSFDAVGTVENGFQSIVQPNQLVPFDVRHFFWIFDVPDFGEWGNHAHRSAEQVLIPMQGVVRVWLENPRRRKFEFELHRPDQGLLIPARYWHRIQFYDRAVLLVLSSQASHETDYLTDYAVFRTLKEDPRE